MKLLDYTEQEKDNYILCQNLTKWIEQRIQRKDSPSLKEIIWWLVEYKQDAEKEEITSR